MIEPEYGFQKQFLCHGKTYMKARDLGKLKEIEFVSSS